MVSGQQPRITTLTVRASEEAKDYWAEARKDDHICQAEMAEMDRLLHGTNQFAMEADEGLRIGVALLRGGAQSVHARRYGFDPATVDLSLA